MTGLKLGGIQAAVESLQGLPQQDRLRIIAEIALKDPSLAEEIKKHMFQFEDLALMQVADFTKLYQASNKKTFCLALRKVSPDFKNKIKSLMSERAHTMLWEEVENIGPQRLSEVHKAQNEIIQLAKDMSNKGLLALPDKWSTDKVVA